MKKLFNFVSTKGFTMLAIVMSVLALGVLPLRVSAGEGTSIQSCVIDVNDTSQVNVNATVSGVTASDGKLYLFALDVYENSLNGKAPIGTLNYSTGNQSYTFHVPLHYNTAQSGLYKKYVVGVYNNGSYTMVSDYHYITNPEVIAPFNYEKQVAATKKGIAGSLYGLKDLNADNGLINITYEGILSTTPTGCSYTYDGQTVYFKENRINELDYLISGMSKNDIVVSLGLASAENQNISELIYPGAENETGVVQYGFNTGNETGTNYVAAVTAFLAERYSDPNSSNGVVSNWYIGNEVNDEKVYYHIGASGVDDFTEKYMQTFRVMYNIIRSHCANADVYTRMANLWYVEQETDNYAGKIFLEKFNSLGMKQGNFDWSVSYHPYSCPLDDADVLDDGEIQVEDVYGRKRGLAEHAEDTFQITMYNIEVLTDFLQKSEFLAPDGSVRSVTLSEQGYTSKSKEGGEEQLIQAASIAYAYYRTECNPYIESFTYYRYQDDPNTLAVEPNWSYGLLDLNGNKKYAFNVYKNINTSDSLKVTEFAKRLYGIDSWSEIIPEFNQEKMEQMPQHIKAPIFSASALKSGNVVVGDMTNNWKLMYNMIALTQYNIGPGGNANRREDRSWAVTSGDASVNEFEMIKHDFTTPLNLTNSPYLEFDFELALDPYKQQSISQSDLYVKLYNGENVFEASAIVDVGQNYGDKQYHMYLDLTGCSFRNSIDKMEVWVNQHDSSVPIVAELMVYDVQYIASQLTGTALPTLDTTANDINGADIAAIGTQSFTGSYITPAVSVTNHGTGLVSGRDYIVNYYDNKDVGQARAVITGINGYTGSKTVNFMIGGGQETTVYNGIDYSAVFDAAYYYSNNKDVADALGYDSAKLLWHFVEYGMPEGRCAKADFNVVKYMYCLLNDDLRAAFGGDMRQYYYHYMNYGRFEGRSISDYDVVFDAQYYLDSNPDVRANIISRYTSDGNTLGWALWHYYEYGMNEGRRGSADFGVLNYEAANPDVFAAYGANYRQATIHYMQFGKGRSIEPKVDMYALPKQRPDVVGVFGIYNPTAWVNWYITAGINEYK